MFPPLSVEQMDLELAMLNAAIAALPEPWRVGRLRVKLIPLENGAMDYSFGLDGPPETGEQASSTPELDAAVRDYLIWQVNNSDDFAGAAFVLQCQEDGRWRWSTQYSYKD